MHVIINIHLSTYSTRASKIEKSPRTSTHRAWPHCTLFKQPSNLIHTPTFCQRPSIKLVRASNLLIRARYLANFCQPSLDMFIKAILVLVRARKPCKTLLASSILCPSKYVSNSRCQYTIESTTFRHLAHH